MPPMDMSQLGADAAGVPGVVRGVEDLPEVTPAPEEDVPTGMVENDDGSVTFVDEEEDKRAAVGFSANLADGYLDKRALQTLGTDLMDAIESDMRVRADRDKQYAEGIKRAGVDTQPSGGADFDGASKTMHPMLSKGCIDFTSRAIKELFPAAGPCRTQIVGESTDIKIDRAERKKTYMNWQLTTQVQENRAELERLLSQLPLGGSQYKRWWFDKALKRPRTETVYVDDVFLPYNQSDFYSAYRVTHRQYIDRNEYQRRVTSGLYRELDLAEPGGSLDDMSEARQQSDKVEGTEEDAYSADNGLREVYQTYVDLEFEDDSEADEDRTVPYIVHIDKWSGNVLGVYRNWKERDPRFAKKHWMVEFTFIPWRGAYGIGLFHMIGSLAISATGAIRAILDSAHIKNFAGGVKLKAGRNSGQTVAVNPTEISEIEAPPGTDDIRKLIMPFPFEGPSQVLFQLLEWLTQQAEGVVTTASERIADGGGSDMPVGTALALIEHDSTNFSSIHARLHHSLKQEMAILHRLNAENLSDSEVVEELGELVVSAQDFKGPVDIIPVSDPNIFSEAQRYAQLQAVLQIKGDPDFKQWFKPDRLLQRMLKLLQIPAAEDIANLPKDPKWLGPLDENYASATKDAAPLKVYEDQDDLMHLQTHIQFMTSPVFGGSELIGQAALPNLIAHAKDHLLNLYRKHTKSAAKAVQVALKMAGKPALPDADAEAHGAALADQVIAQAVAPMVMPGLQQAMAFAKQVMPKPPASPDMQAKIDGDLKMEQLKDAGETQRRQMELAADAQQAQATLAQQTQAAQLAASVEQAQDQTNRAIATMTAQLQEATAEQANQTKLALAELQGENAKELARLQAWLKAGLDATPDYTGALDQLGLRTDQVSKDLSTRIADLQTEQKQDREAILKLLTELQTARTRPWWRGGGAANP